MHTQKTQALTNGINETIDNRNGIIWSFNEKLNDAKKDKLAKQQKRKDKRGTKKGKLKGYKKVKKSHTSKECIAKGKHKVIGNRYRKNTRKDSTADNRSSSATKDNKI